ncbi:MAG: hypothetical protein HGB05_19360, partial [Chloroflexi bacterium]|nr:hypothetical protein [Chloroflexota bacterium]
MVIKSKLIAPQPHRDLYHRARLQEKFQVSLNYASTIIHAGTGFGKTTALLELSGLYNQAYWYGITEPDRDPALFLAHLLSAFLPGTAHLLERLEVDQYIMLRTDTKVILKRLGELIETSLTPGCV